MSSKDGPPDLGSTQIPETRRTFEDVLKDIGEFGPYQIRLFTVLTLMDIATAPCMTYFIFANSNPGWWCTKFQGSNTTYNETGNFTWETCNLDGNPCEEFRFSDELTSITTDWALVCDKGYIPKMTVSIQMAGVLVGAILAGQLGDTIGRRKTLIIMVSSMMIMQTVVGFSNTWELFTVLRFFEGMAVAGTLCISYTLPMEFIGSKYRALCGSLGFFGFGTMLMALVAYLLRDWKYVGLAMGLNVFPLVVAVLWICPESVRWLLQRGRFEEAEEVVRDIARVNKKVVPDMTVLKEISAQAKELKMAENQYSYHDLFRTRKMGARTFALLFAWFNGSLFSYGIGTMYDTFKGTVYVNTLINNSSAMVFGWTVIYTAERFGRRKSYVAYMVIPVVCMIGILVGGAVGVEVIVPDLVTALALIGMGGVIATWNIATIYISEIFPTLTRNIGMGACSMAARIGGILAPQVAYLGEVTHWTVPYMFYGAFSITSMILVWLILPETKGKPLPENMPPRKKSEIIMDGYSAVDQVLK